MSPITRELWFYILRNVNHSDCGKFKRGQNFFQFSEIQEGLHWYVGYRKMTYSKPQITKALRRLCEGNMTATAKATRGILITVCNYEFYQDPKNYEGNDEGSTKDQRRNLEGHTKNKNDKNDKNDNKKRDNKKREKKNFSPPSLDEVKIYFSENGYSEYSAIKAFNYYSTGDWKDSRGNQVKNWKQKMISVWFKEENKKINGKDTHNNFKEKTYECTPDAEISWLND